MKSFLSIFLICFIAYTGFAQFKFGIKAGVGTTQLEFSDFDVFKPNGGDSLNLKLNNVGLGVHFGFTSRIPLGKMFLQPEVLFNSASSNFKLKDYRNPNQADRIIKETYYSLDIPLELGLKMGWFRIQAGPVGHVFISSESELTNISGFETKFNQMDFGYRAGFGIDMKSIWLDFRYEGNFENYGDHIVYAGRKYNFSNRPERFLASLSYIF
jgi:hypothetical protein